MIRLADGSTLAIENVLPGALVMSRTEMNDKLVPRRVSQRHRSSVPETIRLSLSNKQILQLSPRQPLVIEDGRWLRARDIRPGTQLRSSTGQAVRVISANLIRRTRVVYFIEVEDNARAFAADVEIVTVLPIKEDD
jgi:hypothetical protein